jgi:hypothetical protein
MEQTKGYRATLNARLTEQNFVVDGGSEVTRLEEVDGVQVGNIHASRVRGGALAPILLSKSKQKNIKETSSRQLGSGSLLCYKGLKTDLKL